MVYVTRPLRSLTWATEETPRGKMSEDRERPTSSRSSLFLLG